MSRRLLGCLPLVWVLAVAPVVAAENPDLARLAQRLAAVPADPLVHPVAAYERLRAQQALDALAKARGRARAGALYVAERRVQSAEIAARIDLAQRELETLERERADLLVEASRRDAERARAEAERLRIQAQIQAEEAERLRQQALASQQAAEQADAMLEGVADAQAARIEAARERELKLARQEAELVAGRKLPASRREGNLEVFTLAGDAFASGQAALTDKAKADVGAIAAYLAALPGASVQVEGHTDAQGAPDANRALSQRRADAVREALLAGGVARARVRAAGHGAERPVADNATAEGRARNRRVEIRITHK